MNGLRTAIPGKYKIFVCSVFSGMFFYFQGFSAETPHPIMEKSVSTAESGVDSPSISADDLITRVIKEAENTGKIIPITDTALRISPGFSKDADSIRMQIEQMMSDAAQGDADAQYRLGTALLNGKTVKRDPALAVQYFSAAAQQDHPAALFNLGLCYENGYGVPIKRRLSADYYRRAAAFDILPAQFNWALCLRVGVEADTVNNLAEISRNPAESEKILTFLSEKKFLPATRELAVGRLNSAKDKTTYLSAYQNLQSVAAENDPSALRLLGDLCIKPWFDMVPSPDTAFQYYNAAARLGDADAMAKAGWCYEKGIGTAISMESAFKSYTLAAEGGSVMGMTSLADCYLKGNGTKINIDKGLSLLIIAARRNDPAAFYMLGICSYQGIGQKPDYPAAQRLFRAAAEMGYSQAQYNLALMILEGKTEHGTAQEAVDWLEKTAEQNNPDGMVVLAKCMLSGLGCQKDVEYGMLLLRKAARMGHGEANRIIESIINSNKEL